MSSSPSLKLPIFNDHTSTGPYDFDFFPEHKAWQAHVIFGMVAFFQPWIVVVFVMYQLSQFLTKILHKKELSMDDFVDVAEFFIGYGIMRHLHGSF